MVSAFRRFGFLFPSSETETHDEILHHSVNQSDRQQQSQVQFRFSALEIIEKKTTHQLSEEEAQMAVLTSFMFIHKIKMMKPF